MKPRTDDELLAVIGEVNGYVESEQRALHNDGIRWAIEFLRERKAKEEASVASTWDGGDREQSDRHAERASLLADVVDELEEALRSGLQSQTKPVT